MNILVCQLDLKEDLTETHPLILQVNNNKYIKPNTNNGLFLRKGETIRLVCAGTTNKFHVIDVQEIQATCISNKIFSTNIIKLGEINFVNLNCTNVPASIAKRSNAKCLSDKTEIEVGFETFAGFIPLYKTCFDEIKKDSLYSTFTLSSTISIHQPSKRPVFKSHSEFYKGIPDVNTLYANQNKQFETIIGVNNTAKYFDNVYYSRGHLTANADFSYKAQKDATFFYMNIAPQSNNFNGGNWNLLEQNVRTYAGKQFQDLVVYTGVYGQTRLPDAANTLRELYLYAKDVNTYLTVPEIFWKMVYNPYYKTGTVFVGHNNMYEEKFKPVCTDICDRISWLTWDPKNVTAGLAYCCDYYEFQSNLRVLPDLLVFGYLA